MSLKYICKHSDQTDVVIKRHSLRRFDVSINRFSVTDTVVHPNRWPKGMPDRYKNITWTSVRHLIKEAEENGLHVPKHCKEYFDFQTFPGRVACWLRALFH